MRVHLIGLMCGGLILAAGCSFPDFNLGTGNTGATGGAGSNTGTAGTGPGGAGTSGSAGTTTNPTTSSGGSGSSGSNTGGNGGSAGSAGSTTSSTGGTGPCCDCDRDGHDKLSCAGGDDCDDKDENVYPGQAMYFTEPLPGGGYNYDCAGGSTPDPMLNKGLKCSDFNLSQSMCDNAAPGYLNNGIPPCGVAGNWGKCNWAGGLSFCVNQTIDPALKMGCH